MDQEDAGPARFQFTIGGTMIVTAVFAILLAITPTGLAAVVVSSVLAFYYALGRYVLPGPPLPRRRQAAKRGLSNNKPRAAMHSKKPWVGAPIDREL